VFAVDASEPDKKAARTGLREDNEPVAKLVPAGVLAVAAAATGGLLGLLLGFVAALLAIDRLLDRVIGPLGGGGSLEAEHAFRHLRRRRSAGDLTYLPEDRGWVALAHRRRLGTQAVELASIVGTVDQHKATTFDRAFRPPDWSHGRWTLMFRAARRGATLPPVSVYRVGVEHYLRDGHHRVSVAKALGAREIDADVVELRR
jgi:hypothetical protein